ncbi:MAG: CRTAC1 family protein, partial [Gemmatimonadetes bacterium]|nr:CRTAC1 family protein [Gemmatimonadota bacterium]
MNRHLAVVPLAAMLLVAGNAAAQFTDVTTAPLNETFSGLGGGWVDYDSDGDLDLFRTDYSSSSLNRLYRNDNGSFSDRSDADIRWGAVTSKAGAGWADWDGDGDLDVVVSSSGSARLFRLDTPDNYNSVLDLGVSGGRAVCWSDLDVDGDLDLFLAGTGGSAVWTNDGDGTFTQLTFNVRAQGAQLGDYDRDGDPDLLICYDGDGTRLYRNDGPDQWAEIQPELINTNPAAALGSRFVDLDNDGDLDIATASYNNSLPNSIFRNDGAAGFVDVTDESGDFASVTSQTECLAFADWDLDGDLDAYLANNSGDAETTGILLRNDGDLHFTDITTQLPPRTGSLQYFATPGDYDLDGDPDLFVAGWGSPGQLLRNDQQTGNHWLHVTLRGAVETSGIGSWIEVTSGALTQTRYVSGGESWATQSPSPFHLFGLGTATTANVTVHWPSGETTTRTNVPVDRRIEMYEPGAETVTTDPFSPGTTFEFTLDPGVATVQDAVL